MIYWLIKVLNNLKHSITYIKSLPINKHHVVTSLKNITTKNNTSITSTR